MAYLLLYGELPSAKELARFEEAVGRHSAVPATVEQAINALPHDAHFMGSILVGINALSTCHPEQNPALAGQDVYTSKEIQDKQIVRLIGVYVTSSSCILHGSIWLVYMFLHQQQKHCCLLQCCCRLCCRVLQTFCKL